MGPLHAVKAHSSSKTLPHAEQLTRRNHPCSHAPHALRGRTRAAVGKGPGRYFGRPGEPSVTIIVWRDVWTCLNIVTKPPAFIPNHGFSKRMVSKWLRKWSCRNDKCFDIIWHTWIFFIFFQPRVCNVGLQKAPQLNGRRGVVEREAKQKHCSEIKRLKNDRLSMIIGRFEEKSPKSVAIWQLQRVENEGSTFMATPGSTSSVQRTLGGGDSKLGWEFGEICMAKASFQWIAEALRVWYLGIPRDPSDLTRLDSKDIALILPLQLVGFSQHKIDKPWCRQTVAVWFSYSLLFHWMIEHVLNGSIFFAELMS